MAQVDIVIGGGFYGCALAVFLARLPRRVVLVEREPFLMSRASRVNQARLHNGYHYPRSFLTATRSRANFVVFQRLFRECVVDNFRHLYCIARQDSKVGRRHFERFSRLIGLPLRPVSGPDAKLFHPRLVEAVYEVEEPAFDYSILAELLDVQLAAADVEVRTSTPVTRVTGAEGGPIRVALGEREELTADWVFNCTYSGLNQLPGTSSCSGPRLRHQVTELALVELPEPLRKFGVTIMDGSFFSTMPFPAAGLHSFSHVRYTPHLSWIETDHAGLSPDDVLRRYHKRSRFPWMIRDARRYLPTLATTRHVDSLFEVKTLVIGTQVDDARPLLFHRDRRISKFVSILGGKIDNVFDIFHYLGRSIEIS
jgi:glycine/D-amino acid oxidase-like deaminating enzyme